MEKEARKKSSDPIQEHLRETKDHWNHEVSQLIGELISLKRGINGRGDDHAGLPPSSIKDPLPTQISSYLSEVASHYSQVLDHAKTIISEQANYSEHRQKPHLVISNLEQLEKVASWFGSRALSRFTLLSLSGQERRFRIRMLNSCAQIVRELKAFEENILARDEKIIPDAFTDLKLILSEYLASFVALFKNLKELQIAPKYNDDVSEQPAPLNQNLKPNSTNTQDTSTKKVEKSNIDLKALKEKIDNIASQQVELDQISSFLIDEKSNLSTENKLQVVRNYTTFKQALDDIMLELTKDKPTKLEALYTGLLESYTSLKNSLQGYIDFVKSNDPSIDLSVLTKEANLASRWLKEKLLLLKSDNISNMKLEVSASAKLLRRELNNAMDLIEDKRSTIEELEKITNRLNKEIIPRLIDKMLLLGKHYRIEHLRKHKARDYSMLELRDHELRDLVQLGRQIAGVNFTHKVN